MINIVIFINEIFCILFHILFVCKLVFWVREKKSWIIFLFYSENASVKGSKTRKICYKNFQFGVLQFFCEFLQNKCMVKAVLFDVSDHHSNFLTHVLNHPV